MRIEREIGEGSEWVYAYYFPSQATGQSWPHKIGRSRNDPRRRIKQQMASMQEAPVIGTLVRCESSRYTERLIHTRLAKRRLPTYGVEWFDIHPDALINALADGPQQLTIGEQISLARYAQNMTQQQLAAASGLRQATISKVEAGKDCRLSVVLEIARELKLRLALVNP